MTPEPSVAAADEKTNPTPWKLTAETAAVQALRRLGVDESTVTWRDGHLGDAPCAAFDVPATGAVMWVAQVDGTAPEGSWVVATEWGEVGVWWHPHDPALPGLAAAATIGGLRSWLATVAPQVDADQVHLIALQPLHRAVVRVGEPGRAVYVKVVAPWRADRVAQAHERTHAAGLPTPRVLAVEPSTGVVVLAELPGVPLAEHVLTGRPLPHPDEIVDLIRRVADLRLDDGSDVRPMASSLATASQRVIGARPDLRHDVLELVRHLDRIPVVSHRTTVHGDLHDRQLLVSREGTLTGMVDLDDLGAGDLTDDLGRLVAHLAMRAVDHPELRPRVDLYVQSVIAAFSGVVDETQLRHRSAMSMMLSTARRLISSGPDTPDAVEMMLAEATRLVDLR